jgi:hypothetical protein
LPHRNDHNHRQRPPRLLDRHFGTPESLKGLQHPIYRQRRGRHFNVGRDRAQFGLGGWWLLKRTHADGNTKRLELLADKLVEKALDGDVTAIKEIGDRLDGKAKQQIEQDAGLGVSDLPRVIHASGLQ